LSINEERPLFCFLKRRCNNGGCPRYETWNRRCALAAGSASTQSKTPEPFAFPPIRVVRLQPLREHPHQHRHGQERAGNFDQREPFSMVTGDGHGSPGSRITLESEHKPDDRCTDDIVDFCVCGSPGRSAVGRTTVRLILDQLPGCWPGKQSLKFVHAMR